MRKINKYHIRLFGGLTLVLITVVVAFSQLFNLKITPKSSQEEVKLTDEVIDISKLQSVVIPAGGIELPIAWDDLGKRMIADGVIDETKFRALYKSGLQKDEEKILAGEADKVVINQQNSRFIMNMLWAFGLANKNDILENGEMTSEKYGGDASKFASTGGWSLSQGNVMTHYSTHPYITLTQEQQDLVVRVSKGIYRPCCGNSTYFPDCNHGMAMLGLLELMAANDVSEQEIYDVALVVNSYWFPQTYIDLATYFAEQGTDWNKVDAKLALSTDYSSGQGYQATRQKIKSLPEPQQGGGSCGV